jgi:hypothetical protein
LISGDEKDREQLKQTASNEQYFTVIAIRE